MHPARIGHGPRHIPGVLLDRLKETALIGADGVVLCNIGGLVNRRVTHVAVAPAVPGALALVVRVSPGAIGADAVDHLGQFVVLRGRHEIDAPAAVSDRRRTIAEQQPTEERRQSVPFLEQRRVIGAGVRADIHPVERLYGIIGKNVIEHHPPALPHRRVPGPGREVEHRDRILADVVRAVVFALTDRGRELHPMEQVIARFLEVLPRAFAVEPAFAGFVGPLLRHQIERRVIHRPMILRVAPQRHIRAPCLAHGRLGLGGELVPAEIVNRRYRKHPKHVPRGSLHQLNQALGTRGGVLAPCEFGHDFPQTEGFGFAGFGHRRTPDERFVDAREIGRATQRGVDDHRGIGHRPLV